MLKSVVCHVEDPLERISDSAVRSVFTKSCDDLRYYDYRCWELLIESLSGDTPLIQVGSSLKQMLLSATKQQIRRLCSGSVTTFAMRPRKSMEQVSIPEHLLKTYVLQHKYTAYFAGNDTATLVYGVSHIESSVLQSISGFLDGIKPSRYILSLRCSEKVIEELLQANTNSEVTQATLRKVQECLSEPASCMPNVPEPDLMPSYDADTEEGKANIDLAKKLLARIMLAQGFSINTVSIETGLTARQCRLVAAQAKAAKYLDVLPSSNPKSNKTANALLRCADSVRNGSVFMRAYISLGGEAVKNSTNVRHIATAFSLYCAIRHDVYGMDERRHENRLTIHDAWILAADYRARCSYIRECSSCRAHTIRSTKQKQAGCACPFC